MWPAFHVGVPGKWVLAGEHAVLRGAPAVALPHPELRLTLTFQPQVWEGLSVAPERAQPLVAGLLDRLVGPSSRAVARPVGALLIESSIPAGAGLGSSAALCVALVRWTAGPLGLPRGSWLEIARSLEDEFHGRSSGMDVAVVLEERPVLFRSGESPRPIAATALPAFSFHDTGERSPTRECIARVEAFRAGNPALGDEVDRAMGAASEEAEAGLREGDSSRIARAMNRAQECFEAWGLVPPAARSLIEHLRREGRAGVKLTGAGGGGFVVALDEGDSAN